MMVGTDVGSLLLSVLNMRSFHMQCVFTYITNNYIRVVDVFSSDQIEFSEVLLLRLHCMY